MKKPTSNSSVIILIRQLVTPTLSFLLLNSHVQAQSVTTKSTNDLIAQENLIRTVQSFYVKPLIEIQQGTATVRGDERFTKPYASLMRKTSLGVRVGYRSGPFEIETGLSSVRVGAGYKFRPDYDPSLNTRIRSTDYTQIPLTIRYRFWQPTQRITLRAGIGIAYNADLNPFPLAGRLTEEEYTFSAGGTATAVARISSNYVKQTRFWSGEINVSAYYQMSRRLGIVIEGKRLVSSGTVATLDNVREVYNPASTQRFTASGGIYSYNINLGFAYHFGFRNRYKLPNESENP